MNELAQYMSRFADVVPAGLIIPAIVLLALWSVAWKGLALWHAARLSHKGWFIAILLVNTLGILEICYIYIVARKMEGK